MILKHLVTPVTEEHGLKIVRADKIDKSGLITRQILEYIARARLCITDLSFNNPNVFYELGIRHMTHLPSVQGIEPGFSRLSMGLIRLLAPVASCKTPPTPSSRTRR